MYPVPKNGLINMHGIEICAVLTRHSISPLQIIELLRYYPTKTKYIYRSDFFGSKDYLEFYKNKYDIKVIPSHASFEIIFFLRKQHFFSILSLFPSNEIQCLYFHGDDFESSSDGILKFYTALNFYVTYLFIHRRYI